MRVTIIKPVVAALLLSATALSGWSQTSPGAPESGPGMRQHSPERFERMRERMKAQMEQRAAELKAKLKLKPEQETAWSTYLGVMAPPANLAVPQYEDMVKLSTPERLDKIRELRKQRDAEIERRDDATRSFYGVLNPEQKKVFDEETMRFMHENRP